MNNDRHKGLEALEDSVHRLLEDDRSFEDKDKFAQLQSAVGDFLQQCEHPNQLEEIKQRLQRLINYHPVVEENKDALQGQGLNILQMGIPYSINSGVVTVMQNLTEVLHNNMANVAIINHWWHEYSYWDEETNERVNVEISPYCLLTPDGELLKLKWNFQEIAAELQNTFDYTPDICHVHTHTFYHDKSMQTFHDHFSNTPVIYTLHQFIPYLRLSQDDKERLLEDRMPSNDIQEARQENYEGRENAQDAMIKFADEIITISPVHQDAVEKMYPSLREDIHCIPNGTDFHLYNELKHIKKKAQDLRQEYAPHGERTIIYVGRIEEQKGAEPLAKGFNQVANKYDDVQLILIGPDEDELRKLEDFGLNPKYENRIHTTGWIDDEELLAAHYRMGDVMVQPVFSKELYSMASLEAMMMETPVISCPGTLTVGTCESSEAILKGVKQVFNDEHATERHQERVHEKLMEDYSMEAFYQKHIDLYTDAMN